MWKERARAAVYEMAGIYLLVKAVNLFMNRMESTGIEYYLVWIFVVIFIIIGIVMIALGMLIMRRRISNQQKKEQEKETTVSSEEKKV